MPLMTLKTQFTSSEWRLAKNRDSYFLTGSREPAVMLYINNEYICYIPKSDLEKYLVHLKDMDQLPDPSL